MTPRFRLLQTPGWSLFLSIAYAARPSEASVSNALQLMAVAALSVGGMLASLGLHDVAVEAVDETAVLRGGDVLHLADDPAESVRRRHAVGQDGLGGGPGNHGRGQERTVAQGAMPDREDASRSAASGRIATPFSTSADP